MTILSALRCYLPKHLRRPIWEGFSRTLARSGYKLTRTPRTLLSYPEAELVATFDLVVAHMLQFIPEPVFLQIGACDGRHNDPLHKFITRYHWPGAMVEPQPSAFQALCETYRHEDQVELVNAAIAESNGPRKLYRVACDPAAFNGRGMALASFDRNVVLRHREAIPNIADLIVAEDVECMTLDSLLRHIDLDHVDIFQIDTEGYDAKIVKMIDFDLFAPQIIHFEHKHLERAEFEECVELLVTNGYRVSVETIDTVAYRPPSKISPSPNPISPSQSASGE